MVRRGLFCARLSTLGGSTRVAPAGSATVGAVGEHDEHDEYEQGDWEVAGGEPGDAWDEGTQPVDETDEPIAHVTVDTKPDPMHDALAGLRNAHRLQLWRTKPGYAKGFLGTIDLEPGDEVDLASLKAEWGGGTFKIRPQQNTGHGFRFVPGGVTVTMTGDPLEAGRPVGRHGRVIDATAREPNPTPPAPALVRRGGAGTEGMEILGQLFEGLREDLRGVKAELAELREHRANPTPPDPVSEIRKSVAFVKELQQLGALFQGTPITDDDDDDDDEPEQSGMAGLLEKYLEHQINEGNAPGMSPAQPQQAAPQPTLIKAAQRGAPKAPPQQRAAPAQPAPAPQPEPEPEPPDEAAQVLPIDPFRSDETLGDPWEATAVPEPGRAEQTADPVTPEQVAAMLQQMPDDQAVGLLQGAIEHMPPERLMQMVQGMQEERSG